MFSHSALPICLIPFLARCLVKAIIWNHVFSVVCFPHLCVFIYSSSSCSVAFYALGFGTSWNLKFDILLLTCLAQKVVFLVSSGQNEILQLFPPPGKIFLATLGKIHFLPPSGRPWLNVRSSNVNFINNQKIHNYLIRLHHVTLLRKLPAAKTLVELLFLCGMFDGI